MALAKYFIGGREVTKKAFLAYQENEIHKDYLSISSIVERSLLTRQQIDTLISKNLLIPHKYKNKLYFRKEEVANGVRAMSEQAKLFQ